MQPEKSNKLTPAKASKRERIIDVWHPRKVIGPEPEAKLETRSPNQDQFVVIVPVAKRMSIEFFRNRIK
jgi:hypothetical protein